MDLNTAVNKAVDDCIKEGILEDFLREQRAEVIAVSIYEYDQEMHMQDNEEMHLIKKLDDKVFLQQMYDKYSL